MVMVTVVMKIMLVAVLADMSMSIGMAMRRWCDRGRGE